MMIENYVGMGMILLGSYLYVKWKPKKRPSEDDL